MAWHPISGCAHRGGTLASRAILAVVLAFPASNPLLADQGDAWKQVWSGPGGFTARFPVEVVSFGQEIETGFGPASLTVFGANAETRAFFVGYYDYGEDVLLLHERLLDAERERGLRGGSADLVSDEPFKTSEYAGREIVADRQGTGLRVRARNFMVGRRMYSLIAVGPKNPAMDDETRKFFDSFALWNGSTTESH